MEKHIVVRGKKEIIAVFNTYSKLSGEQNTSRPKATIDFINYIAQMPKNEETKTTLIRASKQNIDVSDIVNIPTTLKIPIEIDINIWNKAMSVFKHAFELKNNPQLPYLLRVSGMAYINHLKEENKKLNIDTPEEKKKNIDIIPLEEFRALSIEEKLVEIYKLLIASN